ncbi:MAG: response regulator [Dictyoglomus sp.]
MYYKVFIVDDEPIIREGLKKIVNWNALGFNIIGEAGDGFEALEKISKLDPHLCIIDIKIPEIDGLELISKVKEFKDELKIIILTGYPEFEYAQKAINLGVESYILKPVDPEVLKEELKKIYEQLEKNRILFEGSKEKNIEKFLKGQISLTEKDINQLLHLDLPWDSYQVILISSGNTDNYEIFEELEKFFPFSFIVDGFVGFVVKDFQREKRKIISFKSHLRGKFNEYFVFSIGERVFSICQLTSSYKTALSLLQKRFLYEDKGFIIYSCKKNILGNFRDVDIINEVIQAIESFDFISLENLLEEKMRFHMLREDGEQEIKLSYFDMYITIITTFLGKYPKFKEFSSKYLRKRIFDEFYAKKSFVDLHNYLKELLLDLFKDFSDVIGTSPLLKITEYIEANYYKELKLKNIAKEFGYNPCYLGKIFRKYTGNNFNTYLDKIRINKAKELLFQGEKVVDVAEKVGYKNLDYFIMKFKKYTGKTPKTYIKEITNLP